MAKTSMLITVEEQTQKIIKQTINVSGFRTSPTA